MTARSHTRSRRKERRRARRTREHRTPTDHAELPMGYRLWLAERDARNTPNHPTERDHR